MNFRFKRIRSLNISFLLIFAFLGHNFSGYAGEAIAEEATMATSEAVESAINDAFENATKDSAAELSEADQAKMEELKAKIKAEFGDGEQLTKGQLSNVQSNIESQLEDAIGRGEIGGGGIADLDPKEFLEQSRPPTAEEVPKAPADPAFGPPEAPDVQPESGSAAEGPEAEGSQQQEAEGRQEAEAPEAEGQQQQEAEGQQQETKKQVEGEGKGQEEEGKGKKKVEEKKPDESNKRKIEEKQARAKEQL